jgi:hypothetical protein
MNRAVGAVANVLFVIRASTFAFKVVLLAVVCTMFAVGGFKGDTGYCTLCMIVVLQANGFVDSEPPLIRDLIVDS